MDGKNPFSYPLFTYLWVVGLACFGGIVRHLNNMTKFSATLFFVDVLTAGFTGLVTFWLCEWGNIDDILSAILIATSGLMGNRAWKELEHLWRVRVYRMAGVDPKTDGLPVDDGGYDNPKMRRKNDRTKSYNRRYDDYERRYDDRQRVDPRLEHAGGYRQPDYWDGEIEEKSGDVYDKDTGPDDVSVMHPMNDSQFGKE